MRNIDHHGMYMPILEQKDIIVLKMSKHITKNTKVME